MIRSLKWLIVGLAALAGVLGLWLILGLLFPPVITAEAHLTDTGSTVSIELRPSHVFFAEYHRRLVHRDGAGTEIQTDLFSDSGGYTRTQLYLDEHGDLLVKGYFDIVKVHVAGARTVRAYGVPDHAVYVGAFDFDEQRNWRFFAADESNEVSLIPRGG